MTSALARRLEGWTPLILLAASLTLNGMLIFRHVLRPFRPAVATPLLAGTVIPEIQAERLGGTIETITWSRSSRPTVLYVFSPECSWCRRNLPNVQALIAGTKGAYDFVGLSLSDVGLSGYVAGYRLDIPIYFHADHRVLQDLKLHDTPQTLVISPSGRLIQTWQGAYGPGAQGEVEAIFHVRLPGLQLSPND